jgi:hypothetical protein
MDEKYKNTKKKWQIKHIYSVRSESVLLMVLEDAAAHLRAKVTQLRWRGDARSSLAFPVDATFTIMIS